MKVRIVGTIFGTDGYSSHTRQFANALAELGVDVRLDVPRPLDWVRQVNDCELNMLTKEDRIDDVTIGIVTPPFGRIVLGDQTKKYVQYVVWEGDVVPFYWTEYLYDRRVDMIFVPSTHTKQAILNTLERNKDKLNEKDIKNIKNKIRIVPHGCDTNIFKPKEVERDKKFTFVCNKGWRGGWDDRGGVSYVVKAYCEEFSKDENVCLFLKLNPAYIHPSQVKQKLDALNLPGNRPEIKINFDSLPFKELSNIYNQGDIYVCAQRADAFNLCGLEAMGCGLPTIQTNYGGQTDYMDEDNSYLINHVKLETVKGDVQYEEVQWAIPDIDYLKVIMRHCFKCQEEVKEKGKKAIIDVQNYTWRISAQTALGFLYDLKH